MDETILPSDFKQSGMIIDDEIHALLVQPLPNGCRLTAVMDCCHSGTGNPIPSFRVSHSFIYIYIGYEVIMMKAFGHTQ